MDRRNVERTLLRHFEADPNVVAVYLFGSVAKGTARASSDIDVGALYRAEPPRTLEGEPYADEAELSGEFGRRVQIIVMNRAPADLVHRILRDGVLVLERDKSLRIAFEVRSRNEYFDLLPVLRRYREGTSS
jgi:predicted nucleotidyltransferase